MGIVREETQSILLQKEIIVKNIPIHVVEAGIENSAVIFFIHGWPTCWREFENVLTILSDEYHTVAIDIPGIGESTVPLESYDKRTIAEYVHGVLEAMNLDDVTLVGCDCGGQVVYSLLKNFPCRISHAVIMSVVIPGVDPWDKVKNNPYIWHFRFHQIPDLPEKLVSGNELAYFSYFFEVLAGKDKSMNDDYKNSFVQAYSSPEALKAGFDFYRSFAADENDNVFLKDKIVSKPLLYLRGEDEHVNIELYVNGFKENGILYVETKTIENSGHFSAIEQPVKVALAIRDFAKQSF